SYPNKSNRAIAAQLGVSHVTVGAARGELEATGQIDQLLTTIGRDGKERPAFRVVKPAREPVPDTSKPIIDIDALRKAWGRVERQFSTGDRAAFGVALRSLIALAIDLLDDEGDGANT